MKTNTFCRFFTAAMMLVLVLSLSMLSVSATEMDAPYEGESPFLLQIIEPESGEWTYVQASFVYDPNSGGRYLVTDCVIADLMEEGYLAVLWGDDGYRDLCVLLGADEYFTYLDVMGSLNGAPALTMDVSFGRNLQVGLRETDGETVGDAQYYSTDFSEWTMYDDPWFVNNEGLELPVEYLGAPVLDHNGKCMGFLSMDAESRMVIIPYQLTFFNSRYAIG